MPEKIEGKVKWYSIRKGFGFISPSSDNAPTKEDIFFHQTSIVAEQGKKTKFLVSGIPSRVVFEFVREFCTRPTECFGGSRHVGFRFGKREATTMKLMGWQRV